MGYRDRLPQLDGRPFLTDGGIETVLIFQEGSSCRRSRRSTCSRTTPGTDALRALLRALRRAGGEHGARVRRREPDLAGEPALGAELGYGAIELAQLNRRAIALLDELRARRRRRRSSSAGASARATTATTRTTLMIADEAEAYHSSQVATFAGTAADMVTAITMTYAEEAIGIARAAGRAGMPVVDLVHRRDRRAPAERAVPGGSDRSSRRARPTRAGLLHDQLRAPDALRGDPRGRRRSGSACAACARTPRRCSHAELDEADGARRRRSRRTWRSATRACAGAAEPERVGGCCGTDLRHVTAIAGAVTS